jgi:hypothetical protein
VAFKPVTLKITIDSREEADQFLLGLITAKSNNSSPLFQDLIDGVNSVLQPLRAEDLSQQMSARKAAGMP